MIWRTKLLTSMLVLVLLAAVPACAGAAGSPLAGARFFTDPGNNLAGTVMQQIRTSRPDAAAQLQVIADQPETKRFGSFDDDPGAAVAQYLARAAGQQPGSIPLVSTYRLRHESCGGVADPPDEVARYKEWYERFARGIGARRVVVFLEIDALMTARCLSRHGLDVRVAELRGAIGSLAAAPNALTYVDAGAADVGNPRFFARILRRIGVGRIEGSSRTARIRTGPGARSPTASSSRAASQACATSSTPPRTAAARCAHATAWRTATRSTATPRDAGSGRSRPPPFRRATRTSTRSPGSASRAALRARAARRRTRPRAGPSGSTTRSR